MAKDKHNPIELWDNTLTITSIDCSKCNKRFTAMDDSIEACEYFFEKGWRATKNLTYCPKCAKKFLKL